MRCTVELVIGARANQQARLLIGLIENLINHVFAVDSNDACYLGGIFQSRDLLGVHIRRRLMRCDALAINNPDPTAGLMLTRQPEFRAVNRLFKQLFV